MSEIYTSTLDAAVEGSQVIDRAFLQSIRDEFEAGWHVNSSGDANPFASFDSSRKALGLGAGVSSALDVYFQRVAGPEVQLRNAADDGYVGFDTQYLNIGGVTVIDSSRNISNVEVIQLGSYIQLEEIVKPANPGADKARLYIKAVGGLTTSLFFLDQDGTETDLINDSNLTTGNILLAPAGGALSSTNPPELVTIDDGLRDKLVFDASTDELVGWSFRLPDDFESTPVLSIQFSMASAITGSVEWGMEVMAVSPGDSADIDSVSYDTINTVSTTVPGTAGFMNEVALTLSNFDSALAGDYMSVRFRRNADNDTALGDAELWNVVLKYTR